MSSYPKELKEQVINEYKPNENGYKRLAKKYELKRDTVRGRVLGSRKSDINRTEKFSFKRFNR